MSLQKKEGRFTLGGNTGPFPEELPKPPDNFFEYRGEEDQSRMDWWSEMGRWYYDLRRVMEDRYTELEDKIDELSGSDNPDS